MAGGSPEGLARRLGTTDAVVVGLSAMIGAGVFAAFAPAAAAAHGWLPLSLALAAVVAYCNATSSARLAAVHPESGGTYVYGRRRLGPLWGYLAGWGFTVGKTASCAAMALTFASYVAPGYERPVAVAAVAALTALNLFGVQRSAGVAKAIVAFVLAMLAAVVVAGLLGPEGDGPGWFTAAPGEQVTAWGVLQASGLLFFAFAGYARIATLGEEVRDPARVIPRAVGIALGVTLVVYTLVASAALRTLGPGPLARSTAPLADVVREAGAGGLAPAVQAGAAVAALGALLALLLGVSRTVLAMARERDLPGALAAVDPVRQTPRRAEATVGVAVIVLLLVADLRGAIGFSSFGVLVYYAIANASALRLSRDEGAPPRVVPVAGLVLCLVLAATLPAGSVLAGLAVFAAGLAVYLLRRRPLQRLG
ncbi:basic amino acid/polyamine antiporter, APA family [Nonomuraea maritima]|uniref:Basic amino acid/polyamine antiporter, APA family n=1 Tax=Nonomuraea maritima TaxID=683260 RepID=A0A1G8UW18_9ACTN|nr:APC family permease [Nonomuraea maritima]SDJ57824.1 basic amino acid/polyamine antiporter, APA family [Nonomuraea maritima]